MPTDARFGCAACFGGDAERVWSEHPFEPVVTLVDDSHFTVRIMRCRACGQRAVRTFTEFVDWSGGDDAQYWTVIPLTPEEAEQLIAQGEHVSATLIGQLSDGRWCLQADHPTGKPQRIVWARGPMWIMPA